METPKKGTNGANANANPHTEEELTTPPSGGWGDSEHDTRLHRNLKPHSDQPNYDPDWGHYRHEE